MVGLMVRRASDMFKPGQLIRSARTDRYFIVDVWPFAYPIRNGRVNPNPLRIAHGQWKLVGNNYQNLTPKHADGDE